MFFPGSITISSRRVIPQLVFSSRTPTPSTTRSKQKTLKKNYSRIRSYSTTRTTLSIVRTGMSPTRRSSASSSVSRRVLPSRSSKVSAQKCIASATRSRPILTLLSKRNAGSREFRGRLHGNYVSSSTRPNYKLPPKTISRIVELALNSTKSMPSRYQISLK